MLVSDCQGRAKASILSEPMRSSSGINTFLQMSRNPILTFRDLALATTNAGCVKGDARLDLVISRPENPRKT